MIKVRLAIADGGYVADISIPLFQKLPEVIVWGSRTFGFHVLLTEPEDECVAEFREVFAYHAPPEIRQDVQ